MHVHPRREQFQRFTSLDQGQPVVMVNLLRFEDKAKEGMGADGLTGAEAYVRYMKAFAKMQERYKSEMVFVGTPDAMVIGPENERWDLVLLVRYPTRKAFMDMAMDKEYLEGIATLRTAATLDSRLIATTEGLGSSE